MIRRTCAALLLLAAAALPAAAERGLLSEQSERTYPAAGVRAVRVENARGFTEVKRSGDGQVHVYAFKQVRATRRERERLARLTQVETAREGDVFVIRVRYPRGPALRVSWIELFSGFETPRTEVRLSVEVPPALPVEVRSSSGDLRTARLTGPERLTSTSGDIRIEGAEGAVNASTTSGSIEAGTIASGRLRSVSGDVTVQRAGGTLEVTTTSGSIAIRGAADSLRLATVSGEVTIDGSPRALRLATTSGDVTARGISGALLASGTSATFDLHGAPGLGQVDVSSVSGDVSLALPAGFGGALEMKTTSGTLDVGLPLQVRTVTRRLLRGTVGLGTGRVTLKSTSGDLTITGGGNAP